MSPPRLRSVALYLPQFHPIPQNDEWWGKGYTEWRRVVQAKPQFRGHEQPQLPGQLGYYDLRVPEVREAQASLASAHGIDAFCYYHYWFSGTRLLERPFDEVLASGRPDFPFLLCWANEPWTRAWDGRTGSVLQDQREGVNDAEALIRELLPAFGDHRYLTVGGRPVFLVYRASLLRDPMRTTDIWRHTVTAAGLAEPLLARVESFPNERGDPKVLGFDVAVEFQPDWIEVERLRPTRRLGSMRSLRTLARGHRLIDYRDLVASALAKPAPTYPRWPCVTPSWDNTARRERQATIIQGATPKGYERWVRQVAERAEHDEEPGLLFVNAWNEWSEGCYLEPSDQVGRAYLEAHLRAVSSVRAQGGGGGTSSAPS